MFSPHSSLSPSICTGILSPSIWTGILIITCQIRVLPAFIPLPLNMDRDTYYYLSDPCSPRIHPSPPQYGQGYLLLLVRSVRGAFIPLRLNMDRDTYYYLSDPCSPRIHPSAPQYGQGYLLLLVRFVFSPHSSLSPSIWTRILIITCQIRVLPAFIKFFGQDRAQNGLKVTITSIIPH